MEVGEVRVAEDKDFELLKVYLSRNDGWRLEYDKDETAVWTRPSEGSNFNMIRVSGALKKRIFDRSSSVDFEVRAGGHLCRTWTLDKDCRLEYACEF